MDVWKKRLGPWPRVLLSGALAVLALFLSMSLSGCKDYDDDIKDLQEQIDDARENCAGCDCTDCE